MWDKFVKQWFELAFWWMPGGDSSRTKRQEPPAPSRAEQTVASAPKPAPAPEQASAPKPAPERVADDLTVIKGIGPAVQKKLQGLEILTFGDLAATDPEALTDQLKGSQPISVAQVQGWTEAARERTQTQA